MNNIQKYLQRAKFKAIPHKIKQILLSAVLCVSPLSARAQIEDSNTIKQKIESEIVSNYDDFKLHRCERRAKFLKTLDSLLVERITSLQKAEAHGSGARIRELRNIFPNIPLECHNYYCVYATLQTWKDAAVISGCWEYVQGLEKALNKITSCPNVKNRLDKISKRIGQSLSKNQKVNLYFDQEDKKQQAGASISIDPSNRNTSSGLHLTLYVPQVDKKGNVLRDDNNKIICNKYSFNRNKIIEEASENKSMWLCNVTAICEKLEETKSLMTFIRQKNPLIDFKLAQDKSADNIVQIPNNNSVRIR